MKNITLVIYSFILLALESCEQCGNIEGKEQIQISQSNTVIDSIKIDSSISFQKSVDDLTDFYTTGWQNINKTLMQVTVYVGSTSTTIDFPIKNDQFLFIVLSDTSESSCFPTDPAAQGWETFNENNIQVCLVYNEIHCP